MQLKYVIESLACPSDGVWRKFMEEALEKSPSYTDPCILPPPYKPQEIKAFVEQKIKGTKKAEAWENEYWSSLHKKQRKHEREEYYFSGGSKVGIFEEERHIINLCDIVAFLVSPHSFRLFVCWMD
ncbi:hypothetical protein RND71_026243 [Anisodus tanguticus]|uniref:Glycosyl transferase CAP10 domain-containing protein n=1 Tax=Anisodus tanguticus TaxID=243964 RepID=A0AAE1RMY5_9SOLA|nr:hypothetical protein RND71_026243 [Anisodus tanguticus]